jgi:flotillin
MLDPLVLGGAAAVVLLGTVVFISLFLRRVVPTNEVHIVQSSKKTTSYGKDTGHGNTYYAYPAWFPFIGVVRVSLPMSVFDLDLQNYEAYDKGRLPFHVDVKSFFRIDDSNVAAQRVASFQELKDQLHAIVQGAVRVVLASHDLEEIMTGRSQFGDAFTKEVKEQLKNWGVAAVKNIELMDIRDGKESQVIHQIMAKKKSHIEMESRSEVAKNNKLAQIAEIEAKKETDLQAQDAKQMVGLKVIETERQVELQKQAQVQAVKEQEKLTKEKQMAVVKVEQLRAAEIEQEVQVVRANQEKQKAVITAEGEKQRSIITAEGEKEKLVIAARGQLEANKNVAEGNLELTKREAEGIALVGSAKAAAEKAMLLAPVEAQTTLAKEIGSNENYQKYLITIRQVEAGQAVGVEQAKALMNAEIKIVSTAGTPSAGISSARDLFSANGGVNLGGMLEGFASTEVGKKVVNSVLGDKTNGVVKAD